MTNFEKNVLAIVSDITTKEQLYQDYCVDFLNIDELAEKYGVSAYFIKTLLRLWEITRDNNEAKSYKNKLAKKGFYEDIKNRISKEDIVKWYIEEDNAYADAPNHFGISHWSFDKLCKEYGIKKDRHKSCKKSALTREQKAGGKEAYNQQLEEKRNKSISEKYGSVENYNELRGNKVRKNWENNHKDILDKIYSKKKENHTFNSSSKEDRYYNYLIDKYGEEDVIRYYKDEKRYPFECDFYIKSEDLFIELNLHWTHGLHPFDKNNKEDIDTLNYLKERAEASKFYEKAIEVWTERDVLKREYAIKNKLNYKAFYEGDNLYE